MTSGKWFCGGYCSKGSEPCPGHPAEYIKGYTVCPCGHDHDTTLTIVNHVGDYTGPQACPKCGRGFEPEDFHAFHPALSL